MTAAFPEYVWSTCLRELGMSEEDLAARGQWSPYLYRNSFQSQIHNYVQYQDRPGNSEWFGVSASQVMASIFYDLRRAFRNVYMERFFAQATAVQQTDPDPINGYEAACNLLEIVDAANPDQAPTARALLTEDWRLPEVCSPTPPIDFDLYCQMNFGLDWHAELVGATAYDWICGSPAGGSNGMLLVDACMQQ